MVRGSVFPPANRYPLAANTSYLGS
ncbi:MAG: hypothetical protein RLY37_496, partial [Verrucomicrobiota bacterium]